jgi:predicted small lipoprotein YifL
MKKRNFLMMAAVMFAMTLAACGGKPVEQESKPVDSQPEQSQPAESQPAESQPAESQPAESQPASSQPASSQPAESQPASSQPAESSEAPAVKAVEVSSVDLTLKEAKAYLQIKGTATLFTQEEFKWALALMTTDNNGTASEDYILGGATFADADYNLPATLNTDGTFLFEYNLSDIAAMKPGLFTIKAAVKGLEGYIDVGATNDGVRVKDAVNRYYIRGDVGNKNTIAVDELPPIEFSEASIVVDENGVPWAKVGGETSCTQAELDAFDSYIGLQNTSNWQSTRRTKADGQYYYKIEGTKAYVYFDVSFFEGSVYNAGNQSQAASFGGRGYNTHLNVKANQQADLKMDVAIDEHYVVRNAAGKLIDINVIARPGATEQADFWGNLGFSVNDAFEWDSAAIKTSLGEGATNTEKDFGNGVKGYKFNKADYKSTLTLTPGFTTNEELIHANLKLLISVKLSNNENTQFWKQIVGESGEGTDKTSVMVGTDVTDPENFKEVTHGPEIDFKAAGCTVGSGVTDSGELTVPVWIDIVDIPLTADVENTIQISYLAGGYSYYLCGARVIYHG